MKKVKEIENLEPVPIIDAELDFPKLSVSRLGSFEIAKIILFFFSFSLFPLILIKFIPKKINVLSTSRKTNPLSTFYNNYTFFVRNLNNFNDFLITSFHVFTDEKHEITVPVKVKKTNTLYNWKNLPSQTKTMQVSSNSSIPVVFFSEHINNVRSIRYDVEITHNITDISSIGCFIEYNPKITEKYESAVEIYFLIAIGTLFVIFTLKIKKTGYLYPSQFITQFYVLPMLIFSLPLNIFRNIFSVKLIRVVNGIFSATAKGTTLAIEVWLMMLVTKRTSSKQQRITIATFLIVALSYLCDLGKSLYQTLFTDTLIVDFHLPTVVNFISLFVVSVYSYYVANSQESEDPTMGKAYLFITSAVNTVFLIVYLFEIFEDHCINYDVAFTIKMTSRAALSLILAYIHWPINRNFVMKEERKRDDYTKYVAKSKL